MRELLPLGTEFGVGTFTLFERSKSGKPTGIRKYCYKDLYDERKKLSVKGLDKHCFLWLEYRYVINLNQ